MTAINTANGNSEADTINITADITLSAELPQIASAITINGNGRTISGANTHNIFDVRFTTGDLTINNLILTNGFENQGGAILVQGDLTLNDVVIKNSRAHQDGGAVALTHSQADLVVNRSAFYNNTSTTRTGGAMYLSGKTHKITNSTFYNNSAGGGQAGGALNLGPTNRPTATFELDHVTITANTGLSALVWHYGSLNLRNSLIYGNSNGDCVRTAGTIAVNTGNIFADAPSGYVACGTPFSTADPLLSSSATGSPPYFTIAANSPARNAATCITGSNGVTVDQRGVTRPQESSCDIGAFEYVPPPPPPRPRQEPSGSPARKGDSGAIYIPPNATPSATATPGLSTCLTLPGIVTYNLTESTQCQRLNAEGIGNAEIAAAGFVDAINVWSWVLPGTKICFEAEGSAFKFIDTAPLPRVVYDLPAANENGLTCAIIDRPGNLILLPGNRPPAAQIQPTALQETTLSGCMARTTNILNFRASPGGAVIRAVPYNATLTAVARTVGWFKVDYHGVKGWISAAFVEQIGTCG